MKCLVSRICIVVLLFQSQLGAEVINVSIESEMDYRTGAAFGDAGAYKDLRGTITYAIDPDRTANFEIIDLVYAPRDPNGRVRFTADLRMLVPVDASKASGTLYYEVNNRGNVTTFNQGYDALLRQGHVMVVSGWDAEILPSETKLNLRAPVASVGDVAIIGNVMAEIVTGGGRSDSELINGGSHGGYEPTEGGLKNATLTVRGSVDGERRSIRRSAFHIVTQPNPKPGYLPEVRLEMLEGFEPNSIYELIYEAKNPVVMGLGFAAVRDLVSFLRHDATTENPLAKRGVETKHTIAHGISQSGRFLRQFLYQGFNADELGRQVFDGVIPIVAGGGMGCFNYRFASPTRISPESSLGSNASRSDASVWDWASFAWTSSNNLVDRSPNASITFVCGKIISEHFKSVCVSKGCVDPLFRLCKSISRR